MEKKLSEYSIIELKAMAYDQLAQIEFCQNTLKVINEELIKRSNNPQSVPIPR